jgi:hypothetical protein
MNTYHDYRSPALITASSLNPGELPAEYRIRLAEERAAAEERRRTELLDLTSTAITPSARIRAWERAHGLTLPRAESHPVLKSVAAATHLSLEQVQEEQRRRLMPASAVLPEA